MEEKCNFLSAYIDWLIAKKGDQSVCIVIEIGYAVSIVFFEG